MDIVCELIAKNVLLILPLSLVEKYQNGWEICYLDLKVGCVDQKVINFEMKGR